MRNFLKNILRIYSAKPRIQCTVQESMVSHDFRSFFFVPRLKSIEDLDFLPIIVLF